MSQLGVHNYINLETYKKNGRPVRTPVWFVQDNNGIIYIRTAKNSGKVKRVRNNSHVRIVPCDIRGRPKGEWMDGTVGIISEDEVERINDLISQKYGLRTKVFGIMYKLRNIKFIIVSIHITGQVSK
jgi:PPOX class probable F420-dependent enzyme